MQRFTLDDLTRIMRESAGVDESVDLSGAIEHLTFFELGYDSLAVLELAARVEQEYGVAVPDDATDHMPTPAAALGYLNALLAEEVA